MNSFKLNLNNIPVDSAKEFDYDNRSIFVVRTKKGFYAYENRCPHRGTPLNWLPDKFLTFDNELIQCATHGAQFRIEDGFCVWGPCEGDCLEKVKIHGTN